MPVPVTRIIVAIVVVAVVAVGAAAFVASNNSQGCVGIAAISPSVAVTDYKGYDIWTKPFSGVACPGTDTNPTYEIAMKGVNPYQTPSALVREGFASVQSAKNYIDAAFISSTSSTSIASSSALNSSSSSSPSSSLPAPPILSISPSSGAVGTRINVNGSKFAQLTQYTICLGFSSGACTNGYGRSYVVVKTDSLGSFQATIQVSASASGDSYDYVIVMSPPGSQGNYGLADAKFTITGNPSAPQTAPLAGKFTPEELPRS